MQKSRTDSEKGPCLGEALLVFARHRGIEPDLLARLIRECEPFREIWADYEECCATLLHLERKGAAVSEQVRDYVEMRDHLERDLMRCLEDPLAHPTNGRGTEQRRTK